MRTFIFSIFLLFLFSLTVFPLVYATSVGNAPTVEERDIVLLPGLKKEYVLPVGGASLIDVSVLVPQELSQYIIVTDPAPRSGPRPITLRIAVPHDAKIPPGVYGVSFNANEIPQANGQISTSVSISLGFTFHVYTNEQLLNIVEVNMPPVGIGGTATYSVGLISRSLTDISGITAETSVLGPDGIVLASDTISGGSLPATSRSSMEGGVDVSDLAGGIYAVRTIVTYDGKTTSYNRTTLRVGTLSIDLLDSYTKQFTYNQTNKLQFRLKSNWNNQLTNVVSTVRLLDQVKKSPSVSIASFGESEPLEVYFDRTEQMPGPVVGTVDIQYQEYTSDASKQDKMQVHSFTVPITVDIVMPPKPAVQETTWKPSITQVVIGVTILLLIVNGVILLLLFRRKPKSPLHASSTVQTVPSSIPVPSSTPPKNS